jgi:hypothetical protein
VSNTKEVWIEGVMPFNIYEDEKAKGWLGLMNTPSIGIRIHYASEFYRPIPGGRGQLSMHYFTIDGHEAMRYESLIQMVKDFKAAGCEVTNFMLKDIDDNGCWESYLTKD